jgi:hypothetical protein
MRFLGPVARGFAFWFFRETRNHINAQAAKDPVLFLSGALKVYVIGLTEMLDEWDRGNSFGR